VTHHCHAHGCQVPTRPELLMCRRHWFMVPRPLQQAVYATYRRGQCDDKRPSREWFEAAAAAIGFVVIKENHPGLTVGEAKALEAAGYGEIVEKRRAAVRAKK
jgi:hypothetical protein